MPAAATSPATVVPRTMLWTLAGFALYVAGGLATLFVSAFVAEAVLGSLGIQVDAGERGRSMRNAFHPIVWGMVVAAASMPIGARLVPGLAFGALGWVLLAAGLGLAAVTEYLGNEFVRARYGVYDAEYQGLSYFAAPALVGISLASWASLATPGRQGLPLVAATLAAVLGLATALLPSVGGAVHGIDPPNVPLAAAFTADAMFAAIATFLVIKAAKPGTA